MEETSRLVERCAGEPWGWEAGGGGGAAGLDLDENMSVQDFRAVWSMGQLSCGAEDEEAKEEWSTGHLSESEEHEEAEIALWSTGHLSVEQGMVVNV